MAVISRVGSSRLEGAKRLDAEYYQPRFLELMDIQTKCVSPKRPLVRLCSKIDVGFVGPMAHAYDESGVPLLQTQNVKEFVIGFEHLIYIQEWFHRLLGKSQIYKGDILIARSGSIGNAALVLERDPQPLNSSDIIIIRPSGINAALLCAYLNCRFGQAQIERFSSGGLQGHINLGSLETLQIPLFSNNFAAVIERKVLAGVDLLSVAQGNYAEAEQLLLSELGLKGWKPQHSLTFVRNYSRVVRMRRTDAEHYQPKYDEIAGYISENQPQRLAKLAKQVIETVDFDERQRYRYIEISDVNTSNGEIGFTEREVKDLPPNAKIKVKGGELIVSKVRPTRGAIGVVPDDCRGNGVCSTAFVVLNVPSPVREFLQVYLRSIVGRTSLEQPCKGTSYPTIDDMDVKALPIPTVFPQSQERISDLASQSRFARREAKTILERVKRAVEIAIEENEDEALEFLG